MYEKVHYYSLLYQRCCISFLTVEDLNKLFCLISQGNHHNYTKEGPLFVRKEPIPAELLGYGLELCYSVV